MEIIEEESTETGLKSDEESATCDDENQNSECSYFLTDRQVFTEELRPRIVEPEQPTITSEFEIEPEVLNQENNADHAPHLGESSHSARRQLSRGRWESKSLEARDRHHCASMTPSRVSRSFKKSNKLLQEQEHLKKEPFPNRGAEDSRTCQLGLQEDQGSLKLPEEQGVQPREAPSPEE